MIINEQLRFLVDKRLTVPQMASILGVSAQPVSLRMSMFSLSMRAQYSKISDIQLNGMVEKIQGDFFYCGNPQMHWHLLPRGLRLMAVQLGVCMAYEGGNTVSGL